MDDCLEQTILSVEKMKIATLMSLFPSSGGISDNVKLFIEELNRVRNGIAHRLSYNKSLLENLCKGKQPVSLVAKNKNTKKYYVDSLKTKTFWACGVLHGTAEGIATVKKKNTTRISNGGKD